jgi:hypothetical protein
MRPSHVLHTFLVSNLRLVLDVRIPLIVDTRSRLIADSVPGDRGHPLQVS